MAESVAPRDGDRAASLKENAARIASAMQFFRGLCDHASLIPRPSQLVVAWLAAAVPAGDRGRAVGRATVDLAQLHLAGKPLIQPDDGPPEIQKFGNDPQQPAPL